MPACLRIYKLTSSSSVRSVESPGSL